MSDIKDKAISGVKWTTIEQVATLVLQFVIGIIVARLVDPSDYGLIAMLGIFIAFGNIFVNSGFSIALIRKKDVSQDDYSTAFFFNIIIGSVIYFLLFVSAPLIASFYNIPLLEDITRYYTLTILINSFSIVQIAKLTHELRFRLQFWVNLIALVVSGTIGIYMANIGYGVWALVWQGLSASIIKTLLFNILTKWRPLMVFSMESFKYLFSFGARMLITSVIDVVYDNIYTLVIGKYYSPTSAGYYNRSLHISQLPQSVLSQVVNKVSLPILAPHQDDHIKLLRIYDKMFRATVFFAYPLMTLLAVMSQPVIEVLLGDKWLDSVPYLRILSLSVIFVCLTIINLNLFYVKGRSDIILKMSIIKKIIGFVIVFVMTPLGLEWICFGTILYACFAFIINCSQTKKILNYGLLDQLKSAMPYLLYSSFMAVAVYLSIVYITSAICQVIIGTIVGIISYLSIALIFKDIILLEIFAIVKNKGFFNQCR